MSSESNLEDMYKEVDWLRPSDYPLLQEMAKYDAWHTPKNLSINTEYTNNWTGQRCRLYVKYGLAEKHPDDPGYRISEKGRSFLMGDVDASELQDPVDEE